LLRRFIVLAFALVTLGGMFAAPAGAATSGTTSPVFPSGVVFAGNVNNGPVHKVWTQRLPAAECKAVQKAYPKASCSITVTVDVRKVNGPQKPPAGAQVAARVAPAAATSSYWTYEIGRVTASDAIWTATFQEEVDYHDNCPNANCTDEGVVWNQWLDDSGFSCGACTISEREDGVINNGKQLSPGGDLNGWENFTVTCAVPDIGCNSGHGNRLYFRADGYWWGTHF
jgi:hypothetical protein